MDIDLPALTDSELIDLWLAIDAERVRRANLAEIPGQMLDLNARFTEALGRVDGQEWVQPEGAHDAYARDALVVHEGRTWRSLIDANVWAPPTNWREETGDEWPAWVQPTGATDAYAKGARVTHLERRWISDVDGNVWPPSVFGWTEAT